MKESIGSYQDEGYDLSRQTNERKLSNRNDDQKSQARKARQANVSLSEEEEVVVHFLRTVHVDGANKIQVLLSALGRLIW